MLIRAAGAGPALRGLGFAILLWALWGRPAAATVIDSPPTIEDRKIEFTWQPEQPDTAGRGDPFYTGNTLLRNERVVGPYPPGSTSAVSSILFNPTGDEVYSWESGTPTIEHWRFADGVALNPVQLSGLPNPVELSLHNSGQLLLAALPDGEVAVWILTEPNPIPVTFPAGGSPLRSARFFPGEVDTTDQRFASVSADDSVRVWQRPGQLIDRTHVMVVPDGASGSLVISPDRTLLAAGSNGGRVFLWEVAAPQSPKLIIADDNRHPGPVTRIVWSPDGRTMATADPTGQVRIWNPASGQLLAQFETGVASTPFLEFSPPFGRLLFVGTQDGKLEIRGGKDGVVQRPGEDQLQGAHLTAMARNQDPATRLIMGADNGRLTIVRAGTCSPSQTESRCFGGYMVWRGTSTDVNDPRLTLLRVYTFGDSTWTFEGGTRAFCDPDSIIKRVRPPNPPGPGEVTETITIAGPHNGIPYFYSVTRFDLVYLSGGIFPVFPAGAAAIFQGFYRDPGQSAPTPIAAEAPAKGDTPLLENVVVVPNPYEVGKVPWDATGGRHVEFRNLPDQATIKIYTISGDFVRRIDHGRGKYGQSSSAAPWDLKNAAGREVTSGVYIYRVETPSGEVIQGYFAVVL